MDHATFFMLAAEEARKATCKRGRCGAVIVSNGIVIGRGYNAPPQNKQENCKCDQEYLESRKPKSDRTCCMHAEWRAMLDALEQKHTLEGSTLYFIRVNEHGEPLFSGDPYCTVCSRLALDTNMGYFGLWQKSGPALFSTKEYNDLSYKFHEN